MATSIGEIFVRIGVDASGMASGMNRAEKMLESLGTRMYFLGSRVTAGFSAPLGVAVGAIARFGMEFDQAMTESLAIMENVQPKIRKQMEETARTISEKTKYSATEAAKGYYHLASAGMDAQQAMAALPVVARFAQAGMMDLAKATEYLAGATAALGMKSKDPIQNMQAMSRVADVLTQANNKALGTIEDFASALTNKAGAQMRIYGVNVEQGVAALMAFAEQNIKGKLAGQQLYMVLRDIGRFSVTHAKQWEGLGIHVWDAMGKMRDLGDILMELDSKLKVMNTPKQIRTLTDLGFTQRTLAATQAIIDMGGAIKEYEKFLYSAAGTTQQVAEKQMESMKNQLAALWHRFQNIAIVLFSEFIPVIEKKVIPLIERFIDKLKEWGVWLANVDDNTKEWVLSLVGMGIAIGPAITALGAFILLIRAALVPVQLLAGAISGAFRMAGFTQGIGIAGGMAIQGGGNAASVEAALAGAATGYGSRIASTLQGAGRAAASYAGPIAIVASTLAALRAELGSWERVGNVFEFLFAPLTLGITSFNSSLKDADREIRAYTGWVKDGTKETTTWGEALKTVGSYVSEEFGIIFSTLNDYTLKYLLETIADFGEALEFAPQAWEKSFVSLLDLFGDFVLNIQNLSGKVRALLEDMFPKVAGTGTGTGGSVLSTAAETILAGMGFGWLTNQAKSATRSPGFRQGARDLYEDPAGWVATMFQSNMPITPKDYPQVSPVPGFERGGDPAWEFAKKNRQVMGEVLFSQYARRYGHPEQATETEVPFSTPGWVEGARGEMSVLDLSPADAAQKRKDEAYHDKVVAFTQFLKGEGKEAWRVFNDGMNEFLRGVYSEGGDIHNIPAEELDRIWEAYNKLRGTVNEDQRPSILEDLFAPRIAKGNWDQFAKWSTQYMAENHPGFNAAQTPAEWELSAGITGRKDMNKASAAIREYYDNWVAKAEDSAAVLADITGGVGVRDALMMKSKAHTLAESFDDTLDKMREEAKGLDGVRLEGAKWQIAQMEKVRDQIIATDKKTYSIRLAMAYGYNQHQAVALEKALGADTKKLEKFVKDMEKLTEQKYHTDFAIGIANRLGASFTQMGLGVGQLISMGASNFASGSEVGFELRRSQYLTGAEKWGTRAAAVAQGAGNMYQASQIMDSNQRSLSMTAQGAGIGGSISPGYGHAIGAAAGYIISKFYEPAKAVANRYVKQNYQTTISEALSETIANDTSKWKDNVSYMESSLYHLSDILSEVGGLNAENFNQFSDNFAMLAPLVKSGAMTMEQGTRVLEQNFKAFADYMVGTGEMANRSFVLMIRQVSAANMQTAEFTEFIRSQSEKVSGGLAATVFGVMAYGDQKTYAGLAAQIDEVTKAIKDMEAAGSYGQEYDDAKKKLEELYALQKQGAATNRDDLERLGRLAVATFNAAVAGGTPWLKSMDSMGPVLDALIQSYKDLGLEADGAAIKELLHWRDLVGKNRALVDGTAALHDTMVALSTIGGINAGTFKDMQDQGVSMYNRLIGAGFSQAEALKIMAPFLNDIVKSAWQYGLNIEGATAALILHAKELNLMKDETLSIEQILISGLAAVVEALGGTIPEAWRAMLTEMGIDMDNAVSDIMGKMKIYPEDRGRGRRRGPEVPPSDAFVASGFVAGAFARGGLVTRPTLALVGERGPELIVPWDRVADMANGSEQTINVYQDGRLTARSIVRHLPREVNTYLR